MAPTGAEFQGGEILISGGGDVVGSSLAACVGEPTIKVQSPSAEIRSFCAVFMRVRVFQKATSSCDTERLPMREYRRPTENLSFIPRCLLSASLLSRS